MLRGNPPGRVVTVKQCTLLGGGGRQKEREETTKWVLYTLPTLLEQPCMASEEAGSAPVTLNY